MFKQNVCQFLGPTRGMALEPIKSRAPALAINLSRTTFENVLSPLSAKHVAFLPTLYCSKFNLIRLHDCTIVICLVFVFVIPRCRTQSVLTYASNYVLVALSIDRLDAIARPMKFLGSGKFTQQKQQQQYFY